jgi:hypothetical protein
MMTSHPLALVGSKMHSYEEVSFAPTVEETVLTGKWAQKAEIAELGDEVRPTSVVAPCCCPAPCGCAWAVVGRRAKDAAQPLAASSMPASHQARGPRRIEVAASLRGLALEVLMISAPLVEVALDVPEDRPRLISTPPELDRSHSACRDDIGRL